MPIYEYKCESCSQVSEFLVGMNKDTAGVKCKSCGSAKMQKILSCSNVGGSSKGMYECGSCDIGGASGQPGRCCPHGSCKH